MQRIFVVPPSSYPLNNTMQSLQLNSNRPNGCLSLTDQDTEHHGFPARKSNAGADCKVRAWQSMIQMRAAGAGVGRAAAPASARADPPQTRPQQLRPRARAPERARPAAPGAPSRAAKAELRRPRPAAAPAAPGRPPPQAAQRGSLSAPRPAAPVLPPRPRHSPAPKPWSLITVVQPPGDARLPGGDPA
jgi:hypothetical protein